MIFIISPHLGSGWKKIQHHFVEKYTSQNHKLMQYSVSPGTMHVKALKNCMKYLDKVATAGDYCVVLDSDAFPVHKDWVKICMAYCQEKKYCAVQRLEADDGRHIAHPCFVFWPKERELKWSTHGRAHNPHVKGSEQQGLWKGLHRSNRHELHPRLYSIYGNIVYHHGAGSRDVSGEHKFSKGLKYQKDFWENPEKFIKKLRGE